MLAPLYRLKRRASILWRRYGAKRTAAQLSILKRRGATALGAVALGLVALAFAEISDGAQRTFFAINKVAPFAPLLITPAAFALAVYLTNRWLSETRGSGIPQVIAASRDPGNPLLAPLISIKTALAKLGLTVMLLFAGGSFGREGPTVQISAAVMVGVHRLFRVPITPGVLIAGGAAGVAAAFNTPLAGVAFAIEELAAAYEQRVAILVMAAVMIAGLTSLGVAGDYVYFGVMNESLSVNAALMAAPVLGVVGGLSGGLFSRVVLSFSARRGPLVSRILRRPILSAALCGLLVAVLGIATGGETFGTGYETTRMLIEGDGQSLWFAPAKYAATLASALSGNPGGIFAPSLAVGAGIGHLMSAIFSTYPVSAIVVLGMIAHFVGVVRAPLTAVIILSETTSNHAMILPLFATALIADGVSALVCRERLYHGLARPFIRSK